MNSKLKFDTDPQKTFNEGSWNQEQSLKYLIFLEQNKIVMSSRKKKKQFKVFDQMSHFLSSRSSLQCRSHYQKSLQKFKEVKKIISYEKKQIDLKKYRLKLKQFRQEAKIKENYEKLPSSQSSNKIQPYQSAYLQVKNLSVPETPFLLGHLNFIQPEGFGVNFMNGYFFGLNYISFPYFE